MANQNRSPYLDSAIARGIAKEGDRFYRVTSGRAGGPSWIAVSLWASSPMKACEKARKDPNFNNRTLLAKEQY